MQAAGQGFVEVGPGMLARPLYCSDRVLVVEWRFQPGVRVPLHSHREFQVTVCVSGRMRFRLADKEYTLGPGDHVVVEPGVEHEAFFEEETVVVDMFVPPRQQLYEKLCPQSPADRS